MTHTFHEPAREIPVYDNVDVLVLGSGPAGVCAAICAARMKARTLLIEQLGCVGGISTAGLMSHWTGNTRGGIYEEILDRSCEINEQAGRNTINPERLKTVYLQMLQEAGAKVRLYTFVSSPIMEGNSLRGVIVESKSGREAIFAKVIIDATGDGDIAAKAGVPYALGREEDRKMQPATLMFKVAGVDMSEGVFPGSFESNLDVPRGKIQDLAREYLPFPAGHVLLYPSTLPGIVTCNMTNAIDIDGTDADSLTQAECICRSQMEPIIRFLREFVPGFENCYIISSASLIGIRETRHFDGEYTLTKEDILASRQFPDWAVPHASFNFDVHNITGAGLDATGAQKHFPKIQGYSIPYGCLVPKKVENLLLAGRCISGTHLAHSNFRVMPICANLGQAAGVASALSVQKGIPVRRIDVSDLQAALLKMGVRADR
ncbi:MAG: FAD-dependent oxidoreductase [Clostridiaceae bacterium]|nr:FAD-dependent oxidoreductase [Clostridiaceae bacterium]